MTDDAPETDEPEDDLHCQVCEQLRVDCDCFVCLNCDWPCDHVYDCAVCGCDACDACASGGVHDMCEGLEEL